VWIEVLPHLLHIFLQLLVPLLFQGSHIIISSLGISMWIHSKFNYVSEYVLVKLNPGLLWQKLLSTRRERFFWYIGCKIEEETSKMLYLEYIFIWC
jgi:hypothetical protein